MTDLSRMKIPSMRERVAGAEWETRVNVAACYRLIHHFGMDDMIYNHISARVPGEPDHFLINPYGMMYEEVSASSLLKIDLDGNVVLDSGTGYGVNQAGYVIHSAVHAGRADIHSVIHTHSVAGMAVSALDCGLLPLTQNAMFFEGIGMHEYEGPALSLDEQQRMLQDLGDYRAMILRNHGLLSVGPTIQEAFTSMYWLERACQAQIAAMACNTRLHMPQPEVIKLTAHLYKPATRRPYGLLEWPGLLRMLDRKDSSYRH